MNAFLDINLHLYLYLFTRFVYSWIICVICFLYVFLSCSILIINKEILIIFSSLLIAATVLSYVRILYSNAIFKNDELFVRSNARVSSEDSGASAFPLREL